MLTAERFNTLDTLEQVKLAVRHDTLVGHRSQGPRSMHLYAVADFYVEVVFVTKRKSIVAVYASREVGILEPYLKQIDLSELFV
ncbi:hypothetical protein DRJ53_19610 [Paracnuella aquatica]|nr:hypothetical protein DRJ53_19610 [Paracnuella aquatica]